MADQLDDVLAEASAAGSDIEVANIRLILAADAHAIGHIRKALKAGASIDCVHRENGLSALHIAIGNNDIALCRFLIEKCNAGFFPDGFGRWPTLVAAECRVDDALSDYIVEKEAEYLAQNPA